jgi:hypothetical protein
VAESTVQSLKILPYYPAANIHSSRGSHDAEKERGHHAHQATEPPTQPAPDDGAHDCKDF